MEKEVKYLMRLYTYISKKFWGPFFFALGIFTTLVLLGDVFEKMKKMSNGVTTLTDVLTYSAMTVPNWLATIIPVACLLGAIFVISEMVANGEWTASVAGGFSPKQLFKPILSCVLLVVLLTLLAQEFIIPSINLKADEIYYTRVKRSMTTFNPNTEQNVLIKISPSQMLFAKEVDLTTGTMHKVSLDTYNSAWDIANQIVADKMVWDKDQKKWLFENGIERTYVDALDTTEKPFEEEISPVELKPSQMSVSKVEDELLSLRDLTKRIRFYKQSGLAYYATETVRQSKLAAPFVTIIMCLLGMPFAISTKRKSKLVNILASIVIPFTFWWLISMCTSLGENGFINPFFAGWGPVVFFSLVVVAEFRWLKL